MSCSDSEDLDRGGSGAAGQHDNVILPPGTGDGGFAECAHGEACKDGLICRYDLCLPDLGSCASHDDCPGDSYCDSDGVCIPYGVPEGKTHDEECRRREPPDGVNPTQQCEWIGEDTYFDGIYMTPLVADLNLDQDPNKLQPSIIATTFWRENSSSRNGILRVFDGRTCEEQMRFPKGSDAEQSPADEGRPVYAGQLAIGELDHEAESATPHPEIVGLMKLPTGDNSWSDDYGSTVAAWEVDSSMSPPVLKLRWQGRRCGATPDDDQPIVWKNNTGRSWLEYGPGLWDIQGDARPEVVVDKAVFDAEGCLLNDEEDFRKVVSEAASYPGEATTNSKGAFSAVADVDLDGELELVRYDGWYDWVGAGWEPVQRFAGESGNPGHVAIADLGHYSTLAGKAATDPLPEVIIVSAEGHWAPESTGSVRVVSLEGNVVFGPIDIPHQQCSGGNDCFGGHGGPPTASDFDGDGQVEFAAAANVFYAVYDPDCLGSAPPAERPGGQCERADNPLPPTGMRAGVLWAQPSKDFTSSQTGSSIFDFDGDGRSEAVYRDECYLRVYDGATGGVLFSAPAGSGTASEYPVIADADGDFATEIIVPRDTWGGCPSPDPLNPNSEPYKEQGGFAVLRDPNDLWLPSRPIWNQHAYSITHVTDEAKIVPRSEMQRNWQLEGMNNFRQNTQGKLGPAQLADLTVELSNLENVCKSRGGAVTLAAKVCNRGTNPVQDGALTVFYGRPKNESSANLTVCEVRTETLLQVGQCTFVECKGQLPENHDVYVAVDPKREIADCHPDNNDGASSIQLCPVVY